MNSDILPTDIVLQDEQEAILKIQGKFDPHELQLTRIRQRKGIYTVKEVAQYIIRMSKEESSCCLGF